MDADVIVSSHQADLGEDGRPEKLVAVILYIMDGQTIGDIPGV
jgi:hypothetical protein